MSNWNLPPGCNASDLPGYDDDAHECEETHGCDGCDAKTCSDCKFVYGDEDEALGFCPKCHADNIEHDARQREAELEEADEDAGLDHIEDEGGDA